MSLPIYLDNNSTTLLDPAVLQAMSRVWLTPSNPSSLHCFGRMAKGALLKAKQQIADALQLLPQQLLFTSGATEAINLVLRGMFPPGKGGHLIYSTAEHAAVLATVAYLERQGIATTALKPGEWGAVKAEAIAEAIRPDTRLIVVMAVNNETGVKSDLNAIANVAAGANIALFVDGVAWMGKERVDIPPGVTGFCFSAHKFHGPIGSGCLVWRRSWNDLEPILTGGPQQYGRRGGTENLAAIVGLAAAIEQIEHLVDEKSALISKLRDHFEENLCRRLSDVCRNGSGPRVCNTTNLAFLGVDGESLLVCLDQAGLAASHGSACSAGALEPSRVLLEMGYPRQRVSSSLRFSLSRFTTEEEIERAIELVVQAVERLRAFH